MLNSLKRLLQRKPKQIKYRNCITGKYCTKAFADANPNITVGERDR